MTESSVREVIGKSKLDFVLTEGRSEIAERIQSLIQETLGEYKTGIYISTAEMQPAKPPEEVKAAFDDAIKAREDEQRQVNEAEAYRNDVLPKARGFGQLLAEYQRAPEVTRERLYLDAIESVFRNTNKVLIDNDNGNSLMYLPIDKLIDKRQNNSSNNSTQNFNDTSKSSSVMDDTRQRLDQRLRGAR